jgi:hypothetical protein
VNPTAELYDYRRHSSNPSIGSPLDYPYEIPEMHGPSATPFIDQYNGATCTSVRMCGRGDLITENEYLDESHHGASLYLSKRQGDTLSLPAHNTSVISPLVVSPTYNAAVAPSRQEQPADYFASVHVATHVHDDKDHNIDDSEDLKGEREDAGPRIDECPILQEIFAKMDAPEGEYSSDDYSSDNNLRREQKRKSILVEAGSTNEQMVELFGSRRESR